jgi:hypothetical protein
VERLCEEEVVRQDAEEGGEDRWLEAAYHRAQQYRREEEHAGIPQRQHAHDASRRDAGCRDEHCRQRVRAHRRLGACLPTDRLVRELLGERSPTRRARGTLADRPASRVGSCLDGGLHLVVDVLGCLAERELVHCGRARRPEVGPDDAFGLLGDVDLPLPEPQEELFG